MCLYVCDVFHILLYCDSEGSMECICVCMYACVYVRTYCKWQFNPFGMWRCVTGLVCLGVSKIRDAHIFKGQGISRV